VSVVTAALIPDTLLKGTSQSAEKDKWLWVWDGAHFEGDQKPGNMARPERFELPTTWFEARYSIQLSYGRVLESDD
tara:strand:+ start:967 stop:1194 length:228 start_codon:yes stop_codon:yes gene_type:complete